MGSSLNVKWPVLSWCWQRKRPKGKEQRKKGLEGSIATWTARELGGRESHSERSNLERREGAEMGEERGRHRYGFLKDSGRLGGESISRRDELQQPGTGHM